MALQRQIDGGFAWIILLGIIIINISTSPISQCFGIIFKSHFDQLQMNATQITIILHVNNFISCCLGLIIAPVFRRYSFKHLALIGASIVSTAISLTSFANQFWTYIITYCILFGIGQGIIYPTTNLALSTYFIKKRSIAMGIAITVSGLGPSFIPYICNFLLYYYDTNGTVLILGAFSLNAIIGGLLLKPVSSTTNEDSTNNHKR